MHTPKIVYESETATEIHAETVPNEDPVQSVDNEPINDYSEFNYHEFRYLNVFAVIVVSLP